MKIGKGLSVLVIAYKYNDILYALCTEEVKEATIKKLLIVCTQGKNPTDFPAQSFFNEVRHIEYKESNIGMIHNICAIRKMRRFVESNALVTSNHILLLNKYIAKVSKATNIVLVEDGLMNYYPKSDIILTSSQKVKRYAEKFLKIKDFIDINGEKRTYLLKPSLARNFIGTVCQLTIDSVLLAGLNLDSWAFVEGKSIFVGQSLYLNGVMTVEEYNRIVNEVIRKYKIDYYLPHHYATAQEKIECPSFDLSEQEQHLTLEFVATKYDFKIFSFKSTILYSAKLLNPKVHSTMVLCEKLSENRQILVDTVDEIIKI